MTKRSKEIICVHDWIVKVINSCTHHFQYEACLKLILLFEKKFGSVKETFYLYHYFSQKLNDKVLDKIDEYNETLNKINTII